MIASLWADGGCIVRNPSPYGGTWAFCHVDEIGRRVHEASGSVSAFDLAVPHVTNNFTELLAAVLGMESLPSGFDGKIYTDSKITLGRISFKRPKWNGISNAMVARTWAARARLGNYSVVLVGGHPTRRELMIGHRHDGTPVSPHNVWCDEACKQEAKKFLTDMVARASRAAQ